MGELLAMPLGVPRSSPPRRRRRGGQASRADSRALPLSERQRLWRALWSTAPGIGWQRLRQLQIGFGDLELAWRSSSEELRQRLAEPTRLGERGLDKLLAFRAELGPDPISQPPTAEQRRRWGARRMLVCGDAALPTSLTRLERPPLALYWQGRGSLWACLRERRAVAVVGTRRPSRHGETMARAIGRSLAEAGWPVVSGLAEGIDAAAHQGCLEAGGCPVGVLGTPLERTYPRHHATLQAQVGSQGLLVSELPAGTPGQAGHFAARNRLQVALSCAVVLVECPEGSGALHSARIAWQEETPLWVVPADASRVSAAGSNRWLVQGATPLLDASDLVASLGPGPLRRACARHEETASSPGLSVLRNRDALLIAALRGGASLEQLVARLRQPQAGLIERLLELELAGLVRSEQGLWWRPC